MNELLDAIRRGDRDAVAAMLDANPELLRARAPEGVSAVSLSMYHGRPEIAALWVERGAALDIHEAAAVGGELRVRELLASDPSLLNSFSPDGYHPLALAAFFGHPATVRLLLDAGADVNLHASNPQQVAAIHAGAARNDAGIVGMLIERGADVNARQQQGFTALMSAAQNGNRELVDLLLANGADRTVIAGGKTAAECARERGHTDLAEYLAVASASAS